MLLLLLELGLPGDTTRNTRTRHRGNIMLRELVPIGEAMATRPTGTGIVERDLITHRPGIAPEHFMRHRDAMTQTPALHGHIVMPERIGDALPLQHARDNARITRPATSATARRSGHYSPVSICQPRAALPFGVRPRASPRCRAS